MAKLKLPRDVWLLILDHFRDHVSAKDVTYEWAFDNPAVSTELLSLRLTCRALKTYVDPLLCPIMYVEMNSHSLERFEVLSRNSHIAKGVLGVKVNLGFYRPSFATSLREFYGPLRACLNRLASSCRNMRDPYAALRALIEDDEDSEDEGWDFLDIDVEEEEEDSETESDSDDESDDVEGPEVRENHPLSCPVEAACRRVISELDRYVQMRERLPHVLEYNSNIQPIREKYRTLLDDTQATYRGKVEDQQRIIQDKSFVKTLAMAMSRFGGPIQLALTDVETGRAFPDVKHDQVLDFLNDLPTLRQVLLRPSTWSVAKYENSKPSNCRRDFNRLPSHLLIDLPVSCDQAGVILHGLSISSFPPLTRFGAVTSEGGRSLSQLIKACNNLRSVHIHGYGLVEPPFPAHSSSSYAQRCNEYLAAICSGSQLESLDLCIGIWLNGEGDDTTAVNIQPIIHGLTSTTLTRVKISEVAFHGADLKTLIRKLSPRLTSFELRSIELQSGTYAGAIELLRKRVRASRREIGRSVELKIKYLEGAEFGPGFLLPTKKNKKMHKRVREYLASDGEMPNPLGEDA